MKIYADVVLHCLLLELEVRRKSISLLVFGDNMLYYEHGKNIGFSDLGIEVMRLLLLFISECFVLMIAFVSFWAQLMFVGHNLCLSHDGLQYSTT